MNFVEKLDNLLKERHITKTELSRQINVSEGTIRQWYNGKMPTLDKVIKISQYFTISIDELVGNQNFQNDNISLIYKMLQPEDKQIVDIIFNKYKNNENNTLSLTSKIG